MIRKLAWAVCLATTLSLNAHAADKQKLDDRVHAANDVLHELMATPDHGLPDDIASKATCVIVVPGFKKGAFIVGAELGHGVATCRTGHGWSAPAFIQLTGASFGPQIGGESTDLVLIAMSHNAAERLLQDKIKLGGDIAVAAGPVGRESQASTTELANAGFLSYSRNKGLFAGINLSGDVVNQNHADTDVYYGANTSFERVLHGEVPVLASSMEFEHTVSELFHAHEHQDAGQ